MPYIRRDKSLITKKQAAELLGITESTLHYRISVGDIPDAKPHEGSRRYYTRKQIEQIKRSLKSKEGK